MKAKVHTVILAAALLAAALPAAAEKSAQQEKFARCSHDSKGLKGEERNKFMSECLKAHESHDAHEADKQKPHSKDKPGPVKEARHEAERHDTQQNRMKACNEQAGRKDLHGDARREFMSDCLKAH
jgi:hypothetical protein